MPCLLANAQSTGTSRRATAAFPHHWLLVRLVVEAVVPSVASVASVAFMDCGHWSEGGGGEWWNSQKGARLERPSAGFRTEQEQSRTEQRRAEQGPACVASQHDAGISGYQSQMQLRGMARDMGDRHPEKGLANPRRTFPALPAGPGPGPAACPWRRAEADNDIDGRLGITTHWAWSSWGLNIDWIGGEEGCAIYHWPVDSRRKGGRG